MNVVVSSVLRMAAVSAVHLLLVWYLVSSLGDAEDIGLIRQELWQPSSVDQLGKDSLIVHSLVLELDLEVTVVYARYYTRSTSLARSLTRVRCRWRRVHGDRSSCSSSRRLKRLRPKTQQDYVLGDPFRCDWISLDYQLSGNDTHPFIATVRFNSGVYSVHVRLPLSLEPHRACHLISTSGEQEVCVIAPLIDVWHPKEWGGKLACDLATTWKEEVGDELKETTVSYRIAFEELNYCHPRSRMCDGECTLLTCEEYRERLRAKRAGLGDQMLGLPFDDERKPKLPTPPLVNTAVLHKDTGRIPPIEEFGVLN